MIKRGAATAAVVLVCLTLTACESTAPIPTPAPSAVVGVWRHGSDVLTISADGDFSIVDMPEGVIEQAAVRPGVPPKGALESVSGTWSVSSGGTDAGGAPGVQLEFQHPREIDFDYGLTLIVSSDSPFELYVFLGRPDSDQRYEFTRS